MKTKMRRRGGEAREEEEKKEERHEKKAHGGHVHHEQMEDLAHAKHLGKIHGEHARATGGRAPRKGGGGVGANERPFSTAKAGEKPAGRHFMSEDD